jgi:hypothetical protein
MTESQLIPGTPSEWREFEVDDYAGAEAGSEEDVLGMFLEDRTLETPFGVILVADPIETIPDALIKRLSAQHIPIRIRREAASDEKKEKKGKKKAKKKAE